MGSEQSSSSRSERPAVSKDEMNRLLAQQKMLYEQKYAELLRIANSQQKNNVAAQHAAREEARREVEKLMKEKQEQLMKQNAQLNNVPPKTSEDQTSTSANFERNRSPYTCAGPVLTNATLAPRASSPNQKPEPTNLYPNLNTSATSHQQYAASSSHSGYGNPAVDNKNIPPLMSLPMPPRSENIQNRQNTDKSFVFVNHPKVEQPTLFPPRHAVPTAPPENLTSSSRDRSLSRNRNRGKGDDELDCPTCKNRLMGNIYQCSSGHSSCTNCKMNSRTCGAWVSRRIGVCGLPITEMRNITLEAYVCERKVKCPNSDEGCSLYMKLADMEVHIKNCPFRELECPLRSIFGQCSWHGKMSKVAEHFDAVHQIHRQANVDTELILLNLAHNNHIVYLVVIGTYNFLFHAKISKEHEKLYMAVMLLGTPQSASKWTYEIHIYNKRQPRRKYQYTDICRSGNTSIDELITDAGCAAVPLAYTDTFVADGCLTYKFYIKKDLDARHHFGNKHIGRGGARRQNR